MRRPPQSPPGFFLLLGSLGLGISLGVSVAKDVPLQCSVLVHALEAAQRHDRLPPLVDRAAPLDVVGVAIARLQTHGESSARAAPRYLLAPIAKTEVGKVHRSPIEVVLRGEKLKTK